MALDFTANTQYVNHGSAASLDQITAGTAILLIKPDTLLDDCVVLSKANWDTGQWGMNVISTGDFDFVWGPWGTRLHMSSSDSQVTANAWNWIAARWDTAGVAIDQQLYYGNLTANFAEVASYSIQQQGSGHDNNSAYNFSVGSSSYGETWINTDHKIAICALFNVRLTLSELILQQHYWWAPIKPSSQCVLFCHYGWNGTSTQPDWSGNLNNGTVTGATLTDHVPIGFFSPPKANDFGPDSNIALDSGADNPANWLQGVKISY